MWEWLSREKINPHHRDTEAQRRLHPTLCLRKGWGTRPKAGAQPEGAAPTKTPFAQKIEAAKAGSLKDAKELLDLLDAVS